MKSTLVYDKNNHPIFEGDTITFPNLDIMLEEGFYKYANIDKVVGKVRKIGNIVGTIIDIDFSSEDNGWAVSQSGALHYNGSVWQIDENIERASGVDVNDEYDVWFADDNGCIHYTNGEVVLIGVDGADIEVEGNLGVIIDNSAYVFGDGTDIYIYNGISWVNKPWGMDGTMYPRAFVHSGQIYVAHGRGFLRFDDSDPNDWISLFWANDGFRSSGIEGENSIWFNENWGDLKRWNGQSASNDAYFVNNYPENQGFQHHLFEF